VTGTNPVTVELGGTYTDAGATATDLSGAVTVVTTSNVDTDTVGAWTVTYTSTDASGNAGTATRTVNVVDTVNPVITSQSIFIIDENVSSIGSVTATDLDTVTFTISATSGPGNLQPGSISPSILVSATGALTFDIAPDYDLQVPDTWQNDKDKAQGPKTYSGYTTGATMDFSATVTASDASGNAVTQDIIVQVRDVGGVDDDTGTGTGTGVGTSTGETVNLATGTGT
jgi:hypothetical protein